MNSAKTIKKHGRIEKILYFKTVLTECEWLEAQQRAKQQLKEGVEWLNSAISKSFHG